MEGTKIELKERKAAEHKSRRDPILDIKYYSTSTFYHSYSFRQDKPYKKFTKDKKPTLNILEMKLPANVKSFNTGSSLDRWAKKRPRLKSSKSDIKTNCDSPKSDQEDEDENCNEDNTNDDNTDILQEDDANLLLNNDEEIDFNVQRLIMESARSERDAGVNSSTEHVEKKKSKRSKTKRITFSLSKPASPETRKVIRVDVTSNYSFDDAEESTNDDDYCERFRDILNDKLENAKDGIGNIDSDFTIMCRKLTLSARD